MKIYFLGDYDPTYIRNDVIISGLQEAGAEVLLSNIPGSTPSRLFTLAKQYIKNGTSADVVFVGSSDSSRWIVTMMKILTFGRKPLVWDAHYSIYDTYVNDRKLAGPHSIKAMYYWFIDQMTCQLADKVLLDANAHIEYFVKTFHVNKEKFIRVLVGANPKKLIPTAHRDPSPENFIVSFHGKYIPLQGVPHIIRAAKLLESNNDIHFKLIGSGQTFAEVATLAKSLGVKNVEFIKRIPYEEIPNCLIGADVSLGIFGDTEKTQKVIANKIYEAVALGVPVISADTPAIRELFTDRENILLCRTADPKDLASKILELKNDRALRERIAKGGRNLFNEQTTPKLIGKQLLMDIEQWLPQSTNGRSVRT